MVQSPINETNQETQVSCIPQGLVLQLWVLHKDLLDRALEHTDGEESQETLLAACCRGDMQLWSVGDMRGSVIGVALTQVVAYGKRKAMRVVALAGNQATVWRDDFYEKLRSFAVANDCDRLEVVGRKGLGRLIAQYGFQPRYTTFTVEV